ncbi:MAG: metal-dependent transcriptional regulator [Deltaproteobacteria bacterium]|nr:metal-dependent transcriptional regulator [Deltaproteobacteria bacterium]
MRKSFEELLEAVWKADEMSDPSLAAVRRICPIDVTDDDLGVLVNRKLLSRDGDLLTLSYEGRNQARSVVRRHRLAESLFATVLDIDAEKQEAVACEVEHILLPELEEAICTLLGHPMICPDGKPIPPGRCCDAKSNLASTVVVNLCDLAPGERGRVSYIKPKHHARLHRLTSFGLTPGTIIEVHQRFPAICIRFEGTELALDRDVADDIFLVKINGATSP